MRGSQRSFKHFVGILMIALAAPGWLHAQTPIITEPTDSNTSPTAPLASPLVPDASAAPTIQLLDKDTPPPSPVRRPSERLMDSMASQIEGATPANMLAFRFDAYYNLRQPSLAGYLFPSPNPNLDTAIRRPETRMDYQELNVYAELSLIDDFSLFFDMPVRWLNPEVNSNRVGPANNSGGLKWRFLNVDGFIMSFWLRASGQWSSSDLVDNNHWSIEPGVLAAWRVTDRILVEGEFRCWIPFETDGGVLAGNFVRYGLGVSYGQRIKDGFWCMPVLEGVGWTILSGSTTIANSPTSFVTESARGQTIVNGYLGLRAGYGEHVDFYAGYGRCFTGDAWQRESWRVEVRFIY